MDVNVHAIHAKPTESRLVRLSGLRRCSPDVYVGAGDELRAGFLMGARTETVRCGEWKL
jgi:hypothetical protein